MKNFGELASEVRQEPTALEEGKKPNSMGPGWMLKADPKLGKAVADAVAKAKEKRRLVGSKTEPVKENVEQLDEMPGANMDTRAVHQHLKKQGWKLTRTSGSHDVFTHSDAKHHIPVPRHRQLKAPLIRGILKQANVNEESMLEDLRNWFSKDHPEGDWKRVNSKGEAIGPCAREPGEPKPKCMSQAKRASLTKKERANAVATKRKHDPNPERKGAPINVSSYGKGKISEDMENLEEKNVPTSPEKWARAKAKAKAKFDVYPSAYANGYAAKEYKAMGGGWKSVSEETDTTEKTEMAQTQLHFIKYAAEEILEYIEMGGEIEEWYQNKLSKVQSDVESLHSYVEGESRRTGMKEEVDPAHKKILDRAKTSVPKTPKGEYDRKVEKYLKKKYTKEDVEQIDELSKKTLGSYVNKAMDSAREMPGAGTNAEASKKSRRFAAVSAAAYRTQGLAPRKGTDMFKKYKAESVEQLDEIGDKTLQSYRTKAHTQIQHYKYAGGKDKPEASSVLAKREPGMATATTKVIQKAKDRVAAQPKREPQKMASYKPLGGRDDKSGRSYSESVAEEVGQMSNSNENPNAGRFTSGPAKKPMKPASIVTAEQTATDLGKERHEVPFEGPYTKNTTKVTTDKSGAKHTAMSRVKHLAKMAARKQAGLKEEQEPEDSYEKTSTPAKRSLSKTAGIVKDLAKNSKSSSKEKADTFQAEPELSSQIIKT